MAGALEGRTKIEILDPEFYFNWIRENDIDFRDADDLYLLPLHEVFRGSYKTRNPPEIRGTGYVVKSLEAALWAFYHSTDFADAVLKAANLGDDADTTAAICGQLAGVFYGYESIPPAWVEILAWKDRLRETALELLALEEKIVASEIPEH
jgi:hypothetical protein